MNAIPFYGKNFKMATVISSDDKFVIGVNSFFDAKLVFQNIQCVDYLICLKKDGTWHKANNIMEAENIYNHE